jgi:hypothetical protein
MAEDQRVADRLAVARASGVVKVGNVPRVNFEIDAAVQRTAKATAAAEGSSLRAYIERAVAESNQRHSGELPKPKK